MKEFIVNLDHTTRQQITVLADTEEDAAMLVHGMYCTTNALSHLPVTCTTGRVICGDVKMVIPTVNYVTRIISDYEDDFPGDEEGEEIDCEHDFSDAADEVEAALEHLEYALSKLYEENAKDHHLQREVSDLHQPNRMPGTRSPWHCLGKHRIVISQSSLFGVSHP